MSETFYFYDLETSGFNPRDARIMQFAGQRTDLNLKPIGEPHNVMIKMTPDIVPDPDAVLVTGITPQMTITDGVTEAEFLKLFWEEIAVPGTVFVGYNTVRFDDEFMRYLHYRNFYDPYEWQWKDGRSRWDLLDLVRMTRALRPEGIKWPFDTKGNPTNRLELLTALNKLEHTNAHDALSDVQASIAVAALIRSKQPKLFDFLFTKRKKQDVADFVKSGQPFVYTSGKYPSEFEKTTVVAAIAENPRKQGVLVWDLRHDPEPYAQLTPAELVAAWKWRPKEEEGLRLPVKTLQFNHCPAVAPLGVLFGEDADQEAPKRLQLDQETVFANLKKLKGLRGFKEQLLAALELLDKERQLSFVQNEQEADAQLYDDFIQDSDKTTMSAIRVAKPAEIADFADNLQDERLKALVPLYKARNYPASLTDEERQVWEGFRKRRLLGGKENGRLARFFARLSELAAEKKLTGHERYLLEELQLYGQSLLPEDDY